MLLIPIYWAYQPIPSICVILLTDKRTNRNGQVFTTFFEEVIPGALTKYLNSPLNVTFVAPYIKPTWRPGHLVCVLQDNFPVKGETRQHVLLKELHVLAFQTKVLVTLEELPCGLHRVLTRHDVPGKV